MSSRTRELSSRPERNRVDNAIKVTVCASCRCVCMCKYKTTVPFNPNQATKTTVNELASNSRTCSGCVPMQAHERKTAPVKQTEAY